jgi:aspartate/methionine/tyrosine aminotransferase
VGRGQSFLPGTGGQHANLDAGLAEAVDHELQRTGVAATSGAGVGEHGDGHGRIVATTSRKECTTDAAATSWSS